MFGSTGAGVLQPPDPRTQVSTGEREQALESEVEQLKRLLSQQQLEIEAVRAKVCTFFPLFRDRSCRPVGGFGSCLLGPDDCPCSPSQLWDLICLYLRYSNESGNPNHLVAVPPANKPGAVEP